MQKGIAGSHDERDVARKRNTGFVIVIALVYASALAGLPLMNFMDRLNYLTYARASLQILRSYAERGWNVVLANEPLWLVVNILLGRVISPENVLRTIIFVPAFVVSYLALRSNPRNMIWVILFLVVPQVLKNHITHLRQGLAIAVFLAGWFSRRRFPRLAFFAMTPFIHAGFFFTLGLLALTHVMRRLRLAADLRLIAFVSLGILTGVGLPWLAPYVGARQFQQYAFAPDDISGLAFLFWGGILALMLLQPRKYLREHAFEIGAILFYLALYPFAEISARVFENTTLLVMLAGLGLREPNRSLFLTCILAYAALTWGQRLLGPGPVF